uniref:Uncharacterized protein n=1 Tax=Ornithorhynchus anatinus TaxID=9258 RepID=A0A6I8PCN5_ORNAN
MLGFVKRLLCAEHCSKLIFQKLDTWTFSIQIACRKISFPIILEKYNLGLDQTATLTVIVAVKFWNLFCIYILSPNCCV